MFVWAARVLAAASRACITRRKTAHRRATPRLRQSLILFTVESYPSKPTPLKVTLDALKLVATRCFVHALFLVLLQPELASHEAPHILRCHARSYPDAALPHVRINGDGRRSAVRVDLLLGQLHEGAAYGAALMLFEDVCERRLRVGHVVVSGTHAQWGTAFRARRCARARLASAPPTCPDRYA